MLHGTALRTLFIRWIRCNVSGIGTYILDLGIVVLLTYYGGVSLSLALAIGFIIGMTTNYIIAYHWAFFGTLQTLGRGYVFFLSFALIDVVIISYATTMLMEHYALTLIVARTLVAMCVGILNFFANAWLNFRVI